MEQSPILIIGHKNPDTDSICSAIAYANLKNQIDSNQYIPKRAGNINSETAFVLDYFKYINNIIFYFPVNLLKIGPAPLLISIFRNNMDLRYTVSL